MPPDTALFRRIFFDIVKLVFKLGEKSSFFPSFSDFENAFRFSRFLKFGFGKNSVFSTVREIVVYDLDSSLTNVLEKRSASANARTAFTIEALSRSLPA